MIQYATALLILVDFVWLTIHGSEYSVETLLLNKSLLIDRFSNLAGALFGFIAMGMLLMYRPADSAQGFYSFLFIAASASFFATILISVYDVFGLFLAIEGMSLMLYHLAAYDRSYAALESGLKYFTTGSFASLFLLAGVFTVILTVGSASYVDIENYIFTSYTDGQLGLKAGFVLICVGLFFKIGSFPGHL
jgi:NADH-quinone oxidoreductase subunit N